MKFNISEYFGAKPVTQVPRYETPAPMPKTAPPREETPKTHKTVRMGTLKVEPGEIFTKDGKIYAKQLVVYLAGKITGDPGYREKFAAAEEKLRHYHGTVVLNPANAPLGLSRADYMRIAFAQIEAADLVLFLPDWKESPGARLEMSYCSYVGKPVRELPRLMEGWHL